MKWETVELNEVLEKIVGGGTPSKTIPDYWNGDIPWCSVKDMVGDKFQLNSTEDSITNIGLEKSSANLIPAGTVITSTRMGLGRAFINKVDMAINQDLKALIPNNRIDNTFLLWTIVNKKEEIEGLGIGSTVKGIRLEVLRALKLKLPPLPTQRKIAAILSAYDDLTENNLKRIKLLEEKAFLRYQQIMNESELFERPILDICYITDGTHDSPKQQTNGIYLVTGKHINSGFIDFSSAYFISETDHEKIQKRSRVDNGDLILSNIGTIGNVAIIEKQFEFSVKNVIIFKPNKDIFSPLLYCFLQSKEMQIRFQQESSGTSQKFISLKYCRDLTIKLPREETLKLFYQEVILLLKLKSLLNQQISKLREARDILLPRLMSGQIEV